MSITYRKNLFGKIVVQSKHRVPAESPGTWSTRNRDITEIEIIQHIFEFERLKELEKTFSEIKKKHPELFI